LPRDDFLANSAMEKAVADINHEHQGAAPSKRD